MKNGQLHQSIKISLVTPAAPRSLSGNRITALRWARILRKLGHGVKLTNGYDGSPSDLLVALHAHKSHASIKKFQKHNSGSPIVVGLAGTDIYHEGGLSKRALESIKLASLLVVLQPKAQDEIESAHKGKARVIFQSSKGIGFHTHSRKSFEVCVVGHLRSVKDPLRTALAVRHLAENSQIRVLHIGRCLTGGFERRASKENIKNNRYHWLGEMPHWRVQRVLAHSRLLVHSSISEGGSNVVSEAIALGVPILASHVPGNIGVLGEDYPGYFPVGETSALAELLERAELDTSFYACLKDHCRNLKNLVEPSREQESWRLLIKELITCRKH